MEKAQLIKEVAREIGFDLCGITTAEPFYELEDFLRLRAKQGWQSEFEHKELEKRINPRLVLPEARSIIALGKTYPPCEQNATPGYGIIARCGRGIDYHVDFRKRMNALVQFLTKDLGVTKAVSMVDTGPLIDRAVAARAGVGWYGKNCSIISPEWGSWIALGEVLLDMDLPVDEPLVLECGQCRRCLEACPSGALFAPYRVNPTICLSQLTQTKAIIPEVYRKLLGNRLYGCDTCQEVCPKNKRLKINEPSLDPGEAVLRAEDLLALTKSQFQQKYGSSAFAWRGKTILQRNAIIALGNEKNPDSVPLLTEVLQGPNTVLRGYSAWALGQIGTRKAKQSLQAALSRETEPWVLEEISAALKN
ncbi:tRNA epoxyqueuosine(34) reductase QueG [Zhaonella formicivorans]|uniref:tRNA epoxyqueuosine(34) reductase QueG n=1 Tax=Zhaonella formicivorans TaxID=2528593 RepID=UPI001D10912F|nr:tRNA epoxyqueuosine(34) reductase QueG [Zhaonella formicivorans]